MFVIRSELVCEIFWDMDECGSIPSARKMNIRNKNVFSFIKSSKNIESDQISVNEKEE